MEKVKMVLDADVLIHFSKADRLSILPDIFPKYKYIILNVVYEELKTIQNQIDNQIYFLKNISIEDFTPSGKMLMEYAMLTNTFGFCILFLQPKLYQVSIQFSCLIDFVLFV